MRLDQTLVERGFCENRSRAQQLISAQQVLLNERVVTKASYKCKESDTLSLIGSQYVSRAAFKLKHFLERHDIGVKGSRCLDVGSSTGGFVQVLLEYGASIVSAVDVGSEQLHHTLKEDSRIDVHEQTDIRDFKEEPYEIVTCDASFISLLYLIPSIDCLSSDKIVLLFKPQFEVGKEAKRNRKGVVLDEQLIQTTFEHFLDKCKALDWQLILHEPSELKGKEGNQETLCYFRKRSKEI
jgi:23S rRNA (cytidine1920-2'-O)/16S rRNA (cytidine1409-2'-O)-methyltransferase